MIAVELALYGLTALAAHITSPPDTSPTHQHAHTITQPHRNPPNPAEPSTQPAEPSTNPPELPQVFDRIIHCESTSNPTARNPTSSASGLYQFIDSTWHYVWTDYLSQPPPTPRAYQADVTDQHRAAAALHHHEGLTPWNASRHCWGTP